MISLREVKGGLALVDVLELAHDLRPSEDRKKVAEGVGGTEGVPT